MGDHVFIDSSVLMYLYSTDEPEKKRRATATVAPGSSWISAQTLIEVVTILRHRYKQDYQTIEQVTEELTEGFRVAPVGADTVAEGIRLARIYHYGYHDSLIIAAALESGCSVLYSQNLHSGQRIEKRLRIHNPFVGVQRAGRQ